jgi:hypothetical protein
MCSTRLDFRNFDSEPTITGSAPTLREGFGCIPVSQSLKAAFCASFSFSPPPFPPSLLSLALSHSTQMPKVTSRSFSYSDRRSKSQSSPGKSSPSYLRASKRLKASQAKAKTPRRASKSASRPSLADSILPPLDTPGRPATPQWLTVATIRGSRLYSPLSKKIQLKRAFAADVRKARRGVTTSEKRLKARSFYSFSYVLVHF